MNKTVRFSLSLTGEFFLALFLVIFTTISIRLAELSLWHTPAFFVDGEHLMATHDAYAWLAGAKGVGSYIDHAFTRLLVCLEQITGVGLSTIGFWSPIMLVPLLALPICLLARALGRPEGGLVFGILTTSGVGFLVRTRLGFCDTDLISLIFPLAVSCALAIYFSHLRKNNSDNFTLLMLSIVLCMGIFGFLGRYVYPGNVSLLFSSYFLGAVLIFFILPASQRTVALSSMLFVFAITFAGWFGALLAGLMLWWNLQRNTSKNIAMQALAWVVVAGAVFILADTHEKILWIAQRFLFYAKSGAPDLTNATAAMRLPDIAQSVREAQNLDWNLIGPRMGGNWIVFSLGMVGFVFGAWRRPVLLFFLPYIVLGLASVKLGNRFTMYGTVGVGVGLGLGLSELMVMLKQSQGRRWIAQLSMACVALWPSAQLMDRVSPVPVLPQTYAQAFVELRNSTEPDALLWQWWDYGYAAQYFAERATMGDGGRQSGPWLYPLAKVHCATSPRQASQLMRYFGQSTLTSGLGNTTDPRVALFAGNPIGELQKKAAPEAEQFLIDLAFAEQDFPSDVPNYLVLSWENLRLGGWIGYYGGWDIVSGTSSSGKIQPVSGEISIDSVAGSMTINNKTVPLDSLDVVEEGKTNHFSWTNGTGSHVLINQFSSQIFLMDDQMYRSMMVQMLIAPPETFAEDFTLVVDKYPWVRVYKVRYGNAD